MNETWRKYSSYKWVLLERFSATVVNGKIVLGKEMYPRDSRTY